MLHHCIQIFVLTRCITIVHCTFQSLDGRIISTNYPLLCLPTCTHIICNDSLPRQLISHVESILFRQGNLLYWMVRLLCNVCSQTQLFSCWRSDRGNPTGFLIAKTRELYKYKLFFFFSIKHLNSDSCNTFYTCKILNTTFF